MTTWREHIAPDEEARFNGFAHELRAMQKARMERRGKPERGLHPKAHLGVTGSLAVRELPAHLRVGPFAQPGSIPLYARFSNGSPRHAHDGVPDIRGFALKLVGVPGRKLIPGLEDRKTQDFLLIQTPALAVATPDDFLTLVRLSAKGQALLVPRLVGALGLGKTLKIVRSALSLGQATSMATTRYHLAAPIRFGEHAAKLDLVPAQTDAPPRTKERDGLRSELVARLQKGPLSWTLRAQLFVDESITPIEDASVRWPEAKAPFVELGTVTLPQQDVGSAHGKAVEDLVERLSFDPWHAVEELRPLGAVMRARSAAYRESTMLRSAAPEPDAIL